MATNKKSNNPSGGFIKLDRNLMSQPEIAKLIDGEGPSGLALYISINLYLAHCEGGWGAYTSRQFSALAVELKKNRSDVRHVIDNYGLFVIDGDRFTSLWMQQQFAQAGQKSRSSRPYLYMRAEEIEKDKEKKNQEKAIVRVSDDTHMASSEEGHPLAPSTEVENAKCNYQDFNHYLSR